MAGQNDASKSTATIKFDPQTYLMTYFKVLQPIVATKTSFDYVIPLDTKPDYPLPVTLAKLLDRTNSNKFTKLKAYQYNSIVPRVRLYRVEYNDQKNISSQKEFIFNKDYKYSVKDMTNPIVRDNSGIKSISWNLAGSNPVTAQKQITVDVEFYFDSINAFSGGDYDTMYTAWTNANREGVGYNPQNFSFCDTEVKGVDGKPSTGTTRNYWSLIFHPQAKKEEYDTFNFRIKAVVGWEDLDPNIISNLNLDGVNEDIQKLTYCFFLNLVKHDFTFNEDGSLILKCNYIASFENETNSYNFNLLGDLKLQIESLKNKSLSELNLGLGGPLTVPSIEQNNISTKIIDVLKETEATSIEPGFAGKFKDTFTYNQIIAGQKLLSQLNNTSDTFTNKCLTAGLQSKNLYLNSETVVEQVASSYQKIVDVVQEQYDTKIIQTKGQFYSKFIKNLLNFENSQNKFYKIQITSGSISAWESWINNNTGNQPPSPFRSDDNIKPVNIDTTYVNSIIDLQIAAQDVTQETLDEKKKILFENTLKKTNDDTTSVVFTTLGHIIDTAYKTIYDNLDSNTALKERLKQNKVILTNISGKQKVFQLGSEGVEANSYDFPNMAYIPIEVSLLQAFYVDRVVKPQKDTYPLFAFIRDILSTLVGSALNASNQYNEEAQAYSDVSLASTIITLGNAGYDLDPIINPNDGKPLAINDSLNLSAFYPNFINITNHSAFYNYFFVYDKNYNDFIPTNNLIEDEGKGIYWYTYGQDYGLIKDIKFTKIDQPYLKEAKATGTQTFFLGQFRDRYNADITMIGNNIYYPGMMLHITPSVEVAGSATGNVSFAQLTGIGGYYSVIEVSSKITEEGYETTLKTIWQFDGSEKRVSDDERCRKILQDAGLTSGDSSSVDSNVLSLIANIAKAAKAKVEAENQDREAQAAALRALAVRRLR